MNLRESIIQILSDKKAKKEGLHVKHIARHIYNSNNNLFSDSKEIDFNVLKNRVNRILLYDVNKKRKGMFVRVVNPNTELVESSVATSVTGLPTAGVWADMLSVDLEPGEYDIIVNGAFDASASADWSLGISSTSGNFSPGSQGVDYAFATAAGLQSLTWHKYGVVVTSPTTYYAKALRSANGTEWGGKMSARRVK